MFAFLMFGDTLEELRRWAKLGVTIGNIGGQTGETLGGQNSISKNTELQMVKKIAMDG